MMIQTSFKIPAMPLPEKCGLNYGGIMIAQERIKDVAVIKKRSVVSEASVFMQTIRGAASVYWN